MLVLAARGDLSAQGTATPDREYTLISTMLGYRGVGGEIAGIRNPTLWAQTGETVKLTIVNGELMVHDIALEKLEVKSTQILDKGATANITFKAKSSDTYFCSLPGHRAAGMEGRLEVTDTAPTVAAGHDARGQRPAAESRLRIGDARQLDGDRRRLRGREGRWPARGRRRQEPASSAASPAPTG